MSRKSSKADSNKENAQPTPSETPPVATPHAPKLTIILAPAKLSKAKAKKPPRNACWSSADDATLIEVLTEQQALGNQLDSGWKSLMWTAAADKLKGSEKRSGGAPKTAGSCNSRWQTVCNSSPVTVFVGQLIISNFRSSKVISLWLKSFEGSQVAAGMKIHTWLLPQMEFGRHISRYV